MVAHRWVVGVDGGGSKTVALIGNEMGKILGRGESGSSNYHNIGAPAARSAIKEAVIEAKSRAGLTNKKLDVAVVALAAINSPRDRKIAFRFVQEAKIADSTFVVHDSVAALYSAKRSGPGIVVISGTGCVAAGINKSDEYARVGGWGYLVDDEGSAYDIGRKALNRAFRSLDGRDSPTQLVSIFKRRFRVKRLEDAQNRIYANGLSVEEIARLALLVSWAADYDETCREILEEVALKLAELACTVARRLKMTNDQFTVTIYGGNFRSGRYLLRPFKARILKQCPRAKITKPKHEPAQGSFALAVSELQARTVSRNIQKWTNL